MKGQEILRERFLVVLIAIFSIFFFGRVTRIGAGSSDLNNAHAYPVPFVPSQGDKVITFTDLSSVATIRIYTVSGELAVTLEETDGDGLYLWDTRNSNGELLGSGVYIYLIKSATAERRGKLIIVR